MKKSTSPQLSLAIVIGAVLAIAFVWYYDVYVNWQPSMFPFAIIALALGVIALTLLTLHSRGEKRPLALIWKTALSLAVFIGTLIGVSAVINNVIGRNQMARQAAAVALPLCAAQVITLYALFLRRRRSVLLGFGLAAAMIASTLVNIIISAGGLYRIENMFISSPDREVPQGQKIYMLWYNSPAPNKVIYERRPKETWKHDPDWEQWSLPLGNGHFGASIFGRTDIERIQVTEMSLSNPPPNGINNFAELYIDFDHPEKRIRSYTRDLLLNDATAHVSYQYKGVTYEREYLTSYPNAVMAVKLTASEPGNISFVLRLETPYLTSFGEEGNVGKTRIVKAQGNKITLSGEMEHYGVQYESQVCVLHEGGKLQADDDRLLLKNADSAVILMALGTNYLLDESVFLEPDRTKKLAGNPHPHEYVTETLEKAAKLGYDAVRASHLEDYQALFSRVSLDLGGSLSEKIPTDRLLNNYGKDKKDRYLEELYFQFGRYLLIASSRKDCLPGGLQGIWNPYESPPWSAGYWHNINIQMNYWPAFTTNLAEMFESYADMNQAFRKLAQRHADGYITQIRESNPEAAYAVPIAEPGTGQNGWAIGTGGWPYTIDGPGGHSGPGTVGLTAKLFWDWYDYTRDENLLNDIVYPTLAGAADFLSKTVIEQGGLLLAYPSASPEQLRDGEYYQTTGCAFDQQMIYENHRDTIAAAELLGIDDDIVRIAKEQIKKLDPVIIGGSGQVKEFREEEKYGELVDEYHHRHISQLVALSPGQTINSDTPEWLAAARVSLSERGDESTGWAMAHRLNAWARVRDGNRAYLLYQTLLKKNTLPNLWDTHPPFQIDGNFGGTAGVAEMLLQSNGNVIEPLPALPNAWASGSFDGLVARGNFVVGCRWNDGKLTKMTIESRKGGECCVRYPGIAGDGDDVVINTTAGEIYVITL